MFNRPVENSLVQSIDVRNVSNKVLVRLSHTLLLSSLHKECTEDSEEIGLAYHLSHTPNHPITEAELSTYEATLQSKTRWWFKKLGLQFAQP